MTKAIKDTKRTQEDKKNKMQNDYKAMLNYNYEETQNETKNKTKKA